MFLEASVVGQEPTSRPASNLALGSAAQLLVCAMSHSFHGQVVHTD